MGIVDRCHGVSLSQTKRNDINVNDRPQMQNDTENEIGRSLFSLIYNCNRLRRTTRTQFIPGDPRLLCSLTNNRIEIRRNDRLSAAQ